MLKIYQYKGCSTCKKALKFLDTNKIKYKNIPIRETPPSKTELKKMLKMMDGELKKLFNTSGQDYRALNIKEKISHMTDAEAIELLAGNGNLIKRPFLLATDWGVVGFKEDVWLANKSKLK